MATRTWTVITVTVMLGIATLACSVTLPAEVVGTTPTPFPTLTPTPTAGAGVAGTPTAQLTAEDIVGRSAERMAKVQSFHFSVKVSGTPVHLGPLISSPVPIVLKSVEGDVVRPDKMQAQITANTLGITTHIGLIRYGGDSYLSSPLTGGWDKLPVETGNAFDPSLLFSPQQGLPALLPSLGLQTVGFGEMQGEIAYHLQAKDVQGVDVTGFGGQKTATIDVWIGMQSFLLRQAEIAEVAPDTKESTVWLLTLSAYDQPASITPPAGK
ncbi:MAG: LppX_LprAFG lipoprotein [Chloroflexi bacterium]|nr:LppX_LprAFG lipoprotein [Chloroflexota bacterium]